MTRERQDGTKRSEILAAATQRFGRDGYEHTKWADVAADVGVGPTALYHYFESKQHCLYVIMEEAVADFQRRFSAITSQTPDPLEALTAVLYDCFDLTEQDIMRNRVLVSEQGLLAVRRSSSREEEARRAARARARQLEFAWASFLVGRDARRRRARERPAPAEPGSPRALQQRLAVVPARTASMAFSRSPTSSMAGRWR